MNLQEATSEHCQGPIFTEERFPVEVPKDSGLSADEYQRLKQFYIGKVIPKQTLSDEVLRAAGYRDWVQFWIDLLLLNWS